ncbi:MAG: hypothetical protein ACRCYQ_14320 [Nocardioides sp.]
MKGGLFREAMMARRKSLIASMYEEHQRQKKAKQREQRKADREFQAERARAQRAEVKQAERDRREADRRAAAEQQAKVRLAKTQEREVEKVLSGLANRRREQALAARIAEADEETARVSQRREELEGVPAARPRAHAAGDASRVFDDLGPLAFAAYVEEVLAGSPYPDGTSGAIAVGIRPESGELLVEMELPGEQVVPAVASYQYIKSKDEIRAVPVKDGERRKSYARLLARLVLRTLAEVFEVSPPTLVRGVLINAFVSATDPATGRPIRPCLISLNVSREKFEELVLDQPAFDPELCLRSFLNAIVSPHPHDLEAVRPVLDFDLSQYKLVGEPR